MKKVLFAIAAIASLMLCSCNKEDQPGGKDGETFSKAEIVVKITDYDGKGAASDDFWNTFSFTVSGKDFNGSAIKPELTKAKNTFTLVCNTKPTDGKDCFATVTINATANLQKKDTYDINYGILVNTIIYDAKGNILKENAAVDQKAKGSRNASQMNTLVNDLTKRPVVNTEFDLCYVQNAFTGNWMYNFGWTTAR